MCITDTVITGRPAFVFINVYMPYCTTDNYHEFVAYLSKIDALINTANTPYVSAIGDYNSDFVKDHAFGKELLSFCTEAGLTISDKMDLDSCYTFVSSSYLTTSWLDHVVCTTSAHNHVSHFKVRCDKITSDHLPVRYH